MLNLFPSQKMANFPDWAPASLVERWERSKNSDKHISKDPEQIISEILQDERHAHMTEEAIENLRTSIYRYSLFLPQAEESQLLERMLTDLRMKNVWRSLQRRQKSDKDYYRFWSACSGAIISWRGESKYSAKEQREFYQKIYDHAAELQSLLGKSKEFHLYSISTIIKNADIEWLVDVLNADPIEDVTKEESYARFCLDEIIPSIHTVLTDIAGKAKEYADLNPLVRKPRSDGAHVHYFVRYLSRFLRGYYGQPLHEVVAVTASVLLDKVEIDAGLVRKLVS